jgi:amino acid permease
MTGWIVNAVGLFLTTVGALLIFLYLWKSPRLAEESAPASRPGHARHRNLLIAAWFLLQCVALILL